jgi:hypothetical protein
VKVLFDQGTPVPLRRQLVGHVIETVYERGWSTMKNGALLTAAESAGFEVFVTTDQQLSHQQNLLGRRLAILILGTTSWPRIRAHVALIQATIDALTVGDYRELPCDPMP